jgi:hypothetical protein
VPDTETVLAVSVKKDNTRLLTWAATIFATLYFAWLASSFYYSTSVFMNMYMSMGVDLPPQTRFLIAFRWFYPLLYLGAIGVVIAKQYSVRERWRNLAITLAVTVVMEAFNSAITTALYRPILEFTEKLGK